MIILQIKRKWFDMILSGEKKEEYREIKPYYTTRLKNNHLLSRNNEPEVWTELVMFKNGYQRNAKTFVAEVKLTIGTGHEEWGAEPNKNYYILNILDIKK